MRITMICIGSMGDVRPYIVLGRELKRRGHSITICAFGSFGDAVLKEGFIFKPISGDVDRFMADIMKPGSMGLAYLQQLRKTMLRIIEPFLRDLEDASKGAEAIIATFFGSVFRAIAEIRHIPYIQTQYFPMDRNPYTPISSVSGMHGGKAWNETTYQLGYLLMSMLERHYLADWRAARGLSERKLLSQPDYILDGHTIPVLYAISPEIMPRPEIWPPNIYMTGAWLDNAIADFTPGDELREFLNAGEPPVYIGFGSMTGNNTAKILRAARDAARMSGVRTVLYVGGSKIDLKSEKNICVVTFVPHRWLFERVSAVVHHGGAGTFSAGVEAGKPMLIIPFGGDQQFWGERAYTLGLGPRPILRERVTATKLARALKKLTGTPQYAVSARELGAKLRDENGHIKAADIIEDELSKWLGKDVRVSAGGAED